MITHLFTIVCRKTIVDIKSNNMSIIDVLEQINLSGPLPEKEGLLPLSFEIVSLWARPEYDEPIRGQGRVEFLDPLKKHIRDFTFDIDLSKSLRMRTTAELNGFPFRGEGLHWIKIEGRINEEDKWKEKALLSVDIKVNGSETT